MPKKLKVFVSWSGASSQQCALLLQEMLPKFNHLIEPFVSSKDIARGDRGFEAITAQLAGSHYGIVCVTPDNRSTPWINYEAGALSREVGQPRLTPLLLLGTTVADLMSTPLTQFQATPADAPEEVLKMIKTINSLCDPPADDNRLDDHFERYWPEWEEGLATIGRFAQQATIEDASPPRPSNAEIQDQMLSLLRQQVDRITALERAVAMLRGRQAGELRDSPVLFDGMFGDSAARKPIVGREGESGV
jgi:hypothetical protein